MASYLQTLIAIRDATAAKLLEAESGGTVPADWSLDGASVSYAAYVAGLAQRLEKYNMLVQQANQPFCIKSRATT